MFETIIYFWSSMDSCLSNPLKTIVIVTCLALAACYPSARAAEPIVGYRNLVADPNLKVALIGDSGYDTNFEAALTLIKNEGANMVLHQGDLDYAGDADGFFAKIDAILGRIFPYLVSIGNHDTSNWNTGCRDSDGCYAQFLKNRMARLGIAPDHPDLNDQMYSITYRGLKMVFVGEQWWRGDTTYAPYIQSQFAADAHIWKICSWHKNQNAMQLGSKGDEMGWGVYETCKNHGAIIATGHEHSYERTKTLSKTQDRPWIRPSTRPSAVCRANPDQLLVGPGRSFGLGVRSRWSGDGWPGSLHSHHLSLWRWAEVQLHLG